MATAIDRFAPNNVGVKINRFSYIYIYIKKTVTVTVDIIISCGATRKSSFQEF